MFKGNIIAFKKVTVTTASENCHKAVLFCLGVSIIKISDGYNNRLHERIIYYVVELHQLDTNNMLVIELRSHLFSNS